MEEAKREEIFVPPKCTEIFNMAWTCMSPSSQFNQIYRKGELENCPAIFGDWEKCIFATLSSDESKKQVTIALRCQSLQLCWLTMASV
jgi:hypothetical protein